MNVDDPLNWSPDRIARFLEAVERAEKVDTDKHLERHLQMLDAYERIHEIHRTTGQPLHRITVVLYKQHDVTILPYSAAYKPTNYETVDLEMVEAYLEGEDDDLYA